MKAIRLLEYGGQWVFDEVPMPTIAGDEILVKIKSTAVNHLDLVKASGAARQILPIDLPWIPGHEFSGGVEQIGSDVTAYAPGDAVFGANGTGGAYAVQLASHAGATVIATASGDDEAYLNSIGASLVIDYRKAQFEKVLREKVDVVPCPCQSMDASAGIICRAERWDPFK